MPITFDRRFGPRLATLCIAATLASAAHGQSPSALEGLIERPPSWQALPPGKPAIGASFAASCAEEEEANPELLAWGRLPPSLRQYGLEKKIGQLLVVSYSGTKPTDAGVRATREAIAQSRIGGVLTFRHNIASAEDISAINRLYLDAHPVLPAMIAVDQEGGLVMRVKPSEGAPDTPAAAEVAETSPSRARDTYDAMAGALAELGFTANFGPVVDLAVNPDNPVITRFGRSFGADPDTVTRYATQFIEAHRAVGVGTALKHFPGHGSSTDDSHDGAIDLTATFNRAEIAPFRNIIADDMADMIMVGHLTLDGMTEEDVPASLSTGAIQGFLRERLCFDGVVVSDDLAMDAVSAHWDATEAIAMMIEASGDIALLSLPAGQGLETIDAIIADLAARARRDADFAAKIDDAFARIVHHKLDLAARRDPAPSERVHQN